MEKKRSDIAHQDPEHNKKQKPGSATSDGTLQQRYGIGAQLLSKMGYVSGQGLGSGGTGIAQPISATSSQTPKSSRSGLGMMSAANAVNDGYYSSSSEEDNVLEVPSVVSFKKSDASEGGDNTERVRSRMFQKLNELENKSILGYRDDDMDTILELRQRLKDMDGSNIESSSERLSSLVDELDDVTNRLCELDTQLPLLDNDLYDATTLEEILNSMKSVNPETFDGIINMILKLPNDDLVDSFISRCIRKVFVDYDWDILNEKTYPSVTIKNLVNNVKYRLDSKKGFLNQTQTSIYLIVFQKIDNYLKGSDFMNNDKDYENVIALLLNFEEVLQYIECYEYILNVYVIPAILNSCEKWDFCDSSQQKTVRRWFQDFSMILPAEPIGEMKEILKRKLIDYCQNWDYETSKVPDERELNFVRELFNNVQGPQIDYASLTSKYFTKRFVKVFWNEYYDPIAELEGWNHHDKAGKETGSILALSVLHLYRALLNEEDNRLIIKSAFNDINKVLFQWLLYANESDKLKALYWFNWFINSSFSSTILRDFEVEEINRTIKFLNNWKFNRRVEGIHSEVFDLEGKLDHLHANRSSNDKESSSHGYTIKNIPMRKVLPTFKDVVEQYCEEHNLLMNKLTNKYAHLKYGKDSSVLVPIFELTRKECRPMNIALKDDILWVEEDESRYMPIFLWKLDSLMLARSPM